MINDCCPNFTQVLTIFRIERAVSVSWYLGTMHTYALECLIQWMSEEESGAWGSVDTRDVIVRLTGQQTNHATSKHANIR